MTRPYDLVVQNNLTKNLFDVEVKTSLGDFFKVNAKQVAFDVLVIRQGAMTTLGVPANGIMYRGISFSSDPAAAWSAAKLVGALKAAGVGFNYTKSPLP